MKSDNTNVPANRPAKDTQPETAWDESAAKEQFLTFLHEGGGDDIGVTYDKFTGRHSSFERYEGDPNKWIARVERHRAIAGAIYRRGQQMASYETYMQAVIFDPVAMTLDEAADEHVSHKINPEQMVYENAIEWGLSVTVEMKPSWKSKRRVGISMTNYCCEVSSLDDAKKLVADEVGSLNYESQFECIEGLTAEQFHEYSIRLRDATVSACLDELRKNWNDPEMVDE